MRSKHFADKDNAPCSCDWVQARLWDYLDGTLNAGDRERLQAHNAACPTCERELQAARRSETALNGAVGMAPAAGDLRPGFYAKLAATETKPRASRRFGWAIAVPALAAGMLAVVLWRPASAPKVSTVPLLVDKPIAIAPPLAKSSVAKTDSSHRIVAGHLAPFAAQNLSSAISSLPRKERLKLAQIPAPIRLTPQEIQRARSSGLVRADVSDWRLYFDAREAAPLGFAASRDRFNKANQPESEAMSTLRSGTPASDYPQREQIDAGLQIADAGTIVFNRTALGVELRQNVQKLAFADSTETDSEAYLEVNDETRNFSYSARHASLQDSDGGEIELSVSGEEPDANPEGAGTE